MSNLEKMTEMLKNDPALAEKFTAETKRLAESGKKDIRETLSEAVQAVFGVELTEEELDQIVKEATELNMDEMANVAGGFVDCTLTDHTPPQPKDGVWESRFISMFKYAVTSVSNFFSF